VSVQAPEVTVLMPVYNAAPHLHDAVGSILGQGFADFELLAVDDCSTDRSVEILASFDDPRIRLVRCAERVRLSGALNRGMAEARGGVVARMDADDLSRPGRLEQQVAYLRARPGLAVCGTWIRRFGSGRACVELYPAGCDRVRAHALFNTPFAHPTVMLRREWFARHGLAYDGAFYPTEDYELWSRVLDLFPCDNIRTALLDYRVHGSSLTGADWSEMDRQASRVSDARLRKLGLDVTADRSRFHRDLAMGRLPAEPAAVDAAGRWLCEILESNRVAGVYDASALRATCADLWLKTCLRAAARGPWAAGRFAASRLSRPRRLSGTLLCLAAALRKRDS